MPLPNTLDLIRELIAIPGPPGQESAVATAVAAHAESLGCAHATDARGNLIIAAPGAGAVPEKARVVVMAHLDEIALMVERIEPDGLLRVVSLGGLLPWKLGEGPVEILASSGEITGVLGFGSIHTNSPESPTVKARDSALTWDAARVFTGLSVTELKARGVRPGTRVVLGRARRTVTEMGDFIAAPFLDDRADVAALLLALEIVKSEGLNLPGVVFAATSAEEVGGHGALYMLRNLQPEVGIALEIGPRVPESRFTLDDQPTVWVHDGYCDTLASDLDLIAGAAEAAKLTPHWQALSRGGSDASCAGSHGLVARPITLAFAAENSHGYEITHKDSVTNLARLLVEVLRRVANGD
ncbi:peptidase M42 [Capsulimonas corticalis]|uniref:Peptidase M42 n=1 Tax=Capsulimonas corticalis TaxID=2219043 RepID=A0A402D140_9BACT|nr:M20/M25/M40 family metallo-hydrolase [Capsulimonas corticalis]BDI31690.1 peptidase M42 [Capsulimonas corticalis]